MSGASTSYADVDDTIVAVCSARGIGPRGIVRLSGPDALGVMRSIFVARDTDAVATLRGFRFVDGQIILSANHRVDAQAYVFTSPNSYTRQDSVELHTAGSPPILEMIVERCIAGGARPAHPGEFTARAFLSGALSLSEAEAVATTINARTDEQLRSARRIQRGDLRDMVVGWQDALTDLLSLVVADIDFAEEPIDFISTKELSSKVSDLHVRLCKLIEAADSQSRIDVVPHVLLLGLPNAGKSTLLNVLSGTDRAIASAVSGTTRDILSAPVVLDGIEVVLLDSAGVDDSPDEVLVHARQRATEAAGTVDLVCIVVDMSVPVDRAEIQRLYALADAPTMLVATKGDLGGDAQCVEGICEGPVCAVSSASGDGILHLRETMSQQLLARSHDAEHSAITLSSNQRWALSSAEQALQRCLELTTTTDNLLDIAELVALELREALDSLAITTGSVSTDDLLGRIFSSFCIGK